MCMYKHDQIHIVTYGAMILMEHRKRCRFILEITIREWICFPFYVSPAFSKVLDHRRFRGISIRVWALILPAQMDRCILVSEAFLVTQLKKVCLLSKVNPVQTPLKQPGKALLFLITELATNEILELTWLWAFKSFLKIWC